MFQTKVTRGLTAALLGVALVGCSSGAGATESVERACTAFQEADEQTVDTVGPFLETMVAESAAAAEADASYQAFADATVVLRDLVTSTPDESQDDLDAEFEELIAALETVETVCGIDEG